MSQNVLNAETLFCALSSGVIFSHVSPPSLLRQIPASELNGGVELGSKKADALPTRAKTSSRVGSVGAAGFGRTMICGIEVLAKMGCPVIGLVGPVISRQVAP